MISIYRNNFIWGNKQSRFAHTIYTCVSFRLKDFLFLILGIINRLQDAGHRDLREVPADDLRPDNPAPHTLGRVHPRLRIHGRGGQVQVYNTLTLPTYILGFFYAFIKWLVIFYRPFDFTRARN